MKQKLVLLTVLITFTLSINAQAVVAAPGVEASVEKLSIQTMQIAFEEKVRQYSYYLDYIAKFTQFIQAINFMFISIEKCKTFRTNFI